MSAERNYTPKDASDLQFSVSELNIKCAYVSKITGTHKNHRKQTQ